MASSSGSTSFSSCATLGGRSCMRGCTDPIGASSRCWVTGPGCCASATVHIAELARIAAAKVAARTPERDGPITLRLERSRQSRFIENSYSLSHLTVDMSVAGTAVCRICLFGSILPKYHEPHFRVGQGCAPQAARRGRSCTRLPTWCCAHGRRHLESLDRDHGQADEEQLRPEPDHDCQPRPHSQQGCGLHHRRRPGQ